MFNRIVLIDMLTACPTEIDFDTYQPCNPKAKASAYYRLVKDQFERLETIWDECYQRRCRNRTLLEDRYAQNQLPRQFFDIPIKK